VGTAKGEAGIVVVVLASKGDVADLASKGTTIKGAEDSTKLTACHRFFFWFRSHHHLSLVLHHMFDQNEALSKKFFDMNGGVVEGQDVAHGGAVEGEEGQGVANGGAVQGQDVENGGARLLLPICVEV
jgi:hypothetical protein